jgi:hypothetical protein
VIRVDVRADIRRALAKLDNAKRNQVPFATAVALTKTAQHTQRELTAEMGRSFQSPTPYTMAALAISSATKGSLRSSVFIKDRSRSGTPQVKYLRTEIEGGARGNKPFENLLIRNNVMESGFYAVPGDGAPLDSFGNVSLGSLKRILSQLGARSKAKANETAAQKVKRNARKSVERYFVIGAQEAAAGGPPHGIYERATFAFGSSIRPIFIFVKKRPQYRRKFNFYGLGPRIARDRFPIEFEMAWRGATGQAR